ncbi:response regulator transcription factor [uncultured Clostridium sp.]|uniref:response regulator transcription factor n=1 Tax=uncultured Clostridium sp. TaxID=59620 RepID=UPI002615161D|nr:response regulator transcription factor [uncultured Clostridium sp.]
MINIILIDDQSIIREGLKMILSLDDEINILAEGENGRDAIKLTNELNPDVILMDIRMPIMNGVDATLEIKSQFPNSKILILTTFNDNDYIFDSLKNGASGYLLKDASPDEIIDAVKTIYKGNLLIHSDVASKLSELLATPSPKKIQADFDLSVLTEREKDVALLISKGLSNKDISKTLFLSEGTIKNYVTKILDKLEVDNRTELALLIN